MTDKKNSPEEIIKISNAVIYETKGEYVNFLEEEIIRGTWESLSYEAIATKVGISEGHVRNTASALWQWLSEGLRRLGIFKEKKITKNNFKCIMIAKKEQIASLLKDAASQTEIDSFIPVETFPVKLKPSIASTIPFQLPETALSADSQVYVGRIEQQKESQSAIDAPGGLVKIEGAKKTGKTSLLLRSLDYAKKKQYQTVYLDFHLVDNNIILNLEKLLKWLCASTSLQLDRPNQIDDFWDEIFGSKTSCTLYFEEYLLSKSDRPIVLALDKVDYLFADIDLALDFFGLLRAWFDKSSHNDLWKKLRLILVYCENKLPLNAKQSPFNIGTTILLSDFSPDEIKELALKYSIVLNDREVRDLIRVVGSLPYDVHRLIYKFAKQPQNFREFLKNYPID
ncbi:MAG: AAA-like domain-containing protein [Prochloraceae cyanobacterium]|nr:AAA-like domain-containing protein [Prochloraceae cyanobacterium]